MLKGIALRPRVLIAATACMLLLSCSGCATYQGRQGAAVGALTGATAGALLDDGNPWRGAVIGGSLGALFGGYLAQGPIYSPYQPYSSRYYQPYPYTDQSYYQVHPQYPVQYPPQYYGYTPSYFHAVRRGAITGGLVGSTAGALLDDGNRWRGGAIGGLLGAFFGGSIGGIRAGGGTVNIPVLNP
jgi:hypothetical protein